MPLEQTLETAVMEPHLLFLVLLLHTLVVAAVGQMFLVRLEPAAQVEAVLVRVAQALLLALLERQIRVAVEALVLEIRAQVAQAVLALSLSNGRKPLKHAQHLHLLVTG
jgi:hypothetical protein